MSDIAQDLGGVVRLLEDMTPGDLIVYDANEGDGWPPRPLWCFKNEGYDSGDDPALQGSIHYGGKEDADAIAAAVNFLRTHSAEIAGALRDAERWRPIESAPRDGRAVILAHMGGKPYIGKWCHDTWVDERGLSRGPSHWRPLPAPPTLDSAMHQGGGGE